MADKKLNEVTKVTNMAYVPVIMADGSVGQISKADLASVVAELVYNNNSPTFNSSNLSVGEEVDTGLASQGLYFLSSNSSGYTGLLIVGSAPTSDFVVTKNGLGYSNEEGITNTLRVYRKERSGTIFVLNNYQEGSARHIRIRRIAKY